MKNILCAKVTVAGEDRILLIMLRIWHIIPVGQSN